MKLHKLITIADTPYPLVDEVVNLTLFTPGRAVFTVQSHEPVTGMVIFSTGYHPKKIKPWFTGFVESATQVDAKQQRLFCRELSAVLFYRLPLALRDVTLRQTLVAISQITGLQFVLPQQAKPYTSLQAPVFYNTANGYHAMDSLAAVFAIKNLIWQQQPDGKVWVGSWYDAPLASRPVEIRRNWETQTTAANGATVPVLPTLRPGVFYNHKVLTSVELSGVHMKLTWESNPWINR